MPVRRVGARPRRWRARARRPSGQRASSRYRARPARSSDAFSVIPCDAPRDRRGMRARGGARQRRASVTCGVERRGARCGKPCAASAFASARRSCSELRRQRRRARPGDSRAAERADAVERQRERRHRRPCRPTPAARRSRRSRDVADERERQVQVLGRGSAAAGFRGESRASAASASRAPRRATARRRRAACRAAVGARGAGRVRGGRMNHPKPAANRPAPTQSGGTRASLRTAGPDRDCAARMAKPRHPRGRRGLSCSQRRVLRGGLRARFSCFLSKNCSSSVE